MKKAEHNNLITLYKKIDGVWKSPEQTPAKFFMDFWIQQGPTKNFIGTGLKRPQEFFTEPRRFPFIPCITTKDIFLQFGKET